ncbi:YhdP family protein [Vibrio sp.]|uniref:TIGR02099 family protein n=1 Tax=Vibrio viridaestus TaxID=2487322 RepID=A0A3N9TF17_9VIBR|nr:YhdP family protein [Vibrio viridaestus]MDC0611782.1 YhdP family protein [Vibrio sp.]RQW62827.1 TIGR02099 family protein [Vibrio viridaestus]
MQLLVSRIVKFIKWGLLALLVLSAILITSLRIALPHLNYFHKEITQWVSQQTQLDISVSDLSGYWRNTHPYISFHDLKVSLPNGESISFEAKRVDLELNVFRSILQRQFVVSELDVNKLDLDISSVDLLSSLSQETEENVLSSTQEMAGGSREIIRVLDNVFLRQLDRFIVSDSTIRYRSFVGDTKTLLINNLNWKNDGRQHTASGLVSIKGTGLNFLDVRANFSDNGSFRDVDGQFYVNAKNVAVGPWLTHYLKKQVGINKGEVSFDSWVTLKKSKPIRGLIALQPSYLQWGKSQQHKVEFLSGLLKLIPTEQGLRVSGHQFKAQTDNHPWPELALNLDWQKENGISLNINQISVADILAFGELIPEINQDADNWLVSLNPGGILSDIRMRYTSDSDFEYSVHLKKGSTDQWSLLPEVHNLSATIYGSQDKAIIHADLQDDILPYGDVFQAPLRITKGHTKLVWQKTDAGWSIWSDKVGVTTPDLQAIGAFKLDFPEGKSPFLSFYTEVNLMNGGESWRYLPTRALGSPLTDYLTSAIQAGEVQTAKLVWYGAINAFPYHSHDGVFQAWVPLKKARFSYDHQWPALTDLDINLLFANDSLHFDSEQAKLMKVQAKRVRGQIAHMGPTGKLDISASVVGKGPDVRQYMMATPLVDSVGAALTTLRVKGDVKSEFQLSIPLTADEQPRAWGWADLNNNMVSMPSLSMDLSNVTGRINFDNDVLSAAGIHAKLLKQNISLDFNGESRRKGYAVRIDSIGDWQVKPLQNYLDKKWIDPLSGRAPWQLGVDLQLTGVGFNYQATLNSQLKNILSEYPYPLNKSKGRTDTLKVQVSGNGESVNARAQVSNAKYQALIDISRKQPIIKSSNLVLGKGSFKVIPFSGHYAAVRLDHFDLDNWIPYFQTMDDSKVRSTTGKSGKSPMIDIPSPESVNLNVKELKVATLDWHDVVLKVKKKSQAWNFDLHSQEATGSASYIAPYDLSVALKQLHLYLPALDESNDSHQPIIVSKLNKKQLVTEFDKDFYRLVPNITLVVDDFWLQGYKVGRLKTNLQREDNQLRWKNIDIVSGKNEIHANGSWRLTEDDSSTHLDMVFKGENNSEILERFGISSGIQKAPFTITSVLDWQGSPWAMRVTSLAGKVSAEFGQGSVSDVNGAAKLLGLFSLDSIIRKMKLDFSDIFDDGLAFDSIKGDGEISKGVFVTNNLSMDTVAGDMDLKGLVDLNQRVIDAEVKFVPDVTSGLPVLSAFAVSPPTALYVLAITTVISPVVEVFTEVNYQVKGPIDSPEVKEISRTKGEYKLPGSLLEEDQQQGVQND